MSVVYAAGGEPGAEPVTTADAKAFARVDVSDDDALIDGLIKSAREFVEGYIHRALITQTLEYRRRGFESYIPLPMPPLQSVGSVKYTDPDGVQQTLDTSIYTIDVNAVPGAIRLAHGQSWPSLRNEANNVLITYTCGYGAAGDDVPAPIVTAIKQIVALSYNEREGASPVSLDPVPYTLRALLDQYINWGS